MSYEVRLMNTCTGEIRTVVYDLPWNEWWWTNGNMGCDCNREWEFKRAGGEEEGAVPSCGFGKYVALDATLENGDVVDLDEV